MFRTMLDLPEVTWKDKQGLCQKGQLGTVKQSESWPCPDYV